MQKLLTPVRNISRPQLSDDLVPDQRGHSLLTGVLEFPLLISVDGGAGRLQLQLTQDLLRIQDPQLLRPATKRHVTSGQISSCGMSEIKRDNYDKVGVEAATNDVYHDAME